jgi:hypothetical protein
MKVNYGKMLIATRVIVGGVDSGWCLPVDYPLGLRRRRGEPCSDTAGKSNTGGASESSDSGRKPKGRKLDIVV